MNFNKKELRIPKNLHEPFHRLINLIPAPYRNDKHVHQTILEYLKESHDFYQYTGN